MPALSHCNAMAKRSELKEALSHAKFHITLGQLRRKEPSSSWEKAVGRIGTYSPPSGALRSFRARSGVKVSWSDLVVVYSTIHHSQCIVPKNISYRLFIHSPAQQCLSQVIIAVYTGESNGQCVTSVQIASKSNVLT